MRAAPRRALLLAGSRGSSDPVAAACGLPHKALVPADGVPMLLRVVRTLLSAPPIAQITLLADARLLAHGLGGELDALIEAGRIALASPQSSPAESVAHALDAMGREDFPVLVTTADHPLLTERMIRQFCDEAPSDTDLVIGLAEAAVIRAKYPDALRTFYRFRGKGYSGCNLFLLATPKARRAVAFWQKMERHRKQPWRLAAAVGLVPLAGFLLGRLSLQRALDHLGGRIGTRLGTVMMRDAEAAIDVDKPADLALVEAILRARG